MATRFFAVLALAAAAAALGLTLVAAVPGARRRVAAALDGRLPLAAGVAGIATLGSLYYSEVAGLIPCELCWYQRICMYPLAVVLGVAAVRHDLSARFQALPLAVIGALIAAYHTVLQTFPGLAVTACDPDAPCTAAPFREFGFVSLPFMALCGFALVAVLLAFPLPPRGVPR